MRTGHDRHAGHMTHADKPQHLLKPIDVIWLGVELIEVDIRDQPELTDIYNMRIPVVMNRRGKVLAEGRISQWRAYGAALRAWF